MSFLPTTMILSVSRKIAIKGKLFICYSLDICSGELREKLIEYYDCVLKNSHYLSHRPDRIFQQAANVTGSVCIYVLLYAAVVHDKGA